MSLLETIKNNLTEARKAKNAATSGVLSTLYSEAAMVGKNDGNREATDAEVVSKVKAFLKNIDETLKALPGGHAQIELLRKEKELLTKYLPQQMSQEELKTVVAEIGSAHEKSMRAMGKIMGELKAKHDGKFDGKLASTLVKDYLAN